MTLGEIKIESLKLMYTNLADDINEDMLENYLNDENYRGYLFAMTGSINRCFGRIENRKVLPSKSYTLEASMGEKRGAFIRFNLDYLIKDIYCVDRIVYENTNGVYVPDYDYMTEGNYLVLNSIKDGETYTVIYKPTIKRVGSGDDEKEIDSPDSIAAIIPYYVKGDLFRDDEPNEASESRNWFEQALDEIAQKPTSKYNTVKTVFNQTEW